MVDGLASQEVIVVHSVDVSVWTVLIEDSARKDVDSDTTSVQWGPAVVAVQRSDVVLVFPSSFPTSSTFSSSFLSS